VAYDRRTVSAKPDTVRPSVHHKAYMTHPKQPNLVAPISKPKSHPYRRDIRRPDEIILNSAIEFYYIYVLRSEKDHKNYIGSTKNLKLRLAQHCNGKVQSTKSRLPMSLIYFEACLDEYDAVKREKYLKTHYGRMFIKNRLKHFFNPEKS
jgi:putative endonuclease